MNTQLKLYRFTIPSRYGLGTLGWDNPSQRKGYFGKGMNDYDAKHELFNRLRRGNELHLGETLSSLELDPNARIYPAS